MARPTKQGIDYFPLDCRFDDKTEMYLIEKGAIGLGVLITIWQMIYSGEGYYIENNKDLHLLIKRKIDSDINEVIDCINVCLDRNIFTKTIHDNHRILTSKAIQNRFFEAAKKKKTVNINENYICSGVNSYQNWVNVGGNATNVKVKEEVKVEVNKNKNKSSLEDNLRTSISDDFIPTEQTKQQAILAMVPKEIVNNSDEVLIFISHQKSNGKTSCDWDEEFFKWLMKAKVFSAKRGNSNGNNKSISPQRETALEQTNREAEEFLRDLNSEEDTDGDGACLERAS